MLRFHEDGHVGAECPRCKVQIKFDCPEAFKGSAPDGKVRAIKLECPACEKPYLLLENGTEQLVPHTLREKAFYFFIFKVLVPVLSLDVKINVQLDKVATFLQKVTTLSKWVIAFGTLVTGLLLWVFGPLSISAEPYVRGLTIFTMIIWPIILKDELRYLYRRAFEDEGEANYNGAISQKDQKVVWGAVGQRTFFLFVVVLSFIAVTLIRLSAIFAGYAVPDPHWIHYFCPHDVGAILIMISLHWVTATHIPPWQRRIIENPQQVFSGASS